MKRKSRGNLGENLALKYLKSKGYQIIERNFRSKLGEIDLVAIEPSSTLSGKDTLVFIEVKARWSEKFGPPEEAITPGKIHHLVKTAQYYKLRHPETPEAMRIDVVAVDLGTDGKVEDIRIIKNVSAI